MVVSRTLLTGLIVLTVASWAVPPAFGQASRLGDTFSTMTGGLRRYPDVAFDSTNKVYLVVSGLPVLGAFVSEDGVPITGPFPVTSTGADTLAPRVAYSPQANAFLVTWLDARVTPAAAQVWGRIIAFSGGAPAFLTPDFQISPAPGGAHPEQGAAIAYSTGSQEFLVAWMQYGPSGGITDIRAQRVNNAGQLLGGGEVVITADNQWQDNPGIGYNPQADEFFVAYSFAPSVTFILGQRVKAGTGALLGGPIQIAAGTFEDIPEVVFNPATGRYLVVWYHIGPGNDVLGRLVNADGSLFGDVIPVAANPFFEGDALGLSLNPVSGTFFAVFHGPGVDYFGVQITGAGVPENVFQVSVSGGTGNFNPRLAAHTTRNNPAQWLTVASRSFNNVIGQRVQTAGGGPTCPPDCPPEPPPPCPPSCPIDLSPGAAPTGSWLFAEGATGGPVGFDTYYLIANETGTTVNARAYFSKDTTQTVLFDFSIPPTTRRTLRLADHIGLVGPGAYGAVIQSRTPGAPIFAQRSTFGRNFEMGHLSSGVLRPAALPASNIWYFAEGSRKSNDFFGNFFLVFNPLTTATTVTATFFRDGASPVMFNYPLPAHGRLTIDANTIPELAGSDFSTRLVATSEIVAEQSMYWENFFSGTNTVGVPAPAPNWFYAEGVAAFAGSALFQTYYTLLNPTGSPVTADVTYLLQGGAPQVRSYLIPANGRSTIHLADELGQVGSVGTEIRTRNGEGIITARSIFWGAGFPWVDGTLTMGATAPATDWHAPEGTNVADFDTFVLVANPNDFAVTVWVRATSDLGQEIPFVDTIPAKQRRTYHMRDAAKFPHIVNRSFSTRVHVVGPGSIIVESAMYWAAHPAHIWRAGSSALAIPQ